FPLAAAYGEVRLRIEGQPCPMLVEGLRTAHAWWESWGGMPTPAPQIESSMRQHAPALRGSRRAVGFLSGGVDSLHMLMRNRRLYARDDPVYIRDFLFIRAFDRENPATRPETKGYQLALRPLERVAAEIGVQILPCRTNPRLLP